MSVILKDMEMPICCYDCALDKPVCEEWVHMSYRDFGEKRSPTCPLVEIPTPHGDLIDRDKLIKEYDRSHVGEPGGARKLMADAESVIEAEE